MNSPILGTGLSGLVGTRIVELLEDKFSFTDVSLATGVDITHADEVDRIVKESESEVILHMAAKTDVDGCEDDKILLEEGPAWMINVIGTQNIVESAKKYNKHVIYISTDFVFDGAKEEYDEDDEPNPVSWYATTKWEGEKAVSGSGINYTIARLSYPYRAICTIRMDFVRRILENIS